MADTGKSNPRPVKGEVKPKAPNQVRLLNIIRKPPPQPVSKGMQRKIAEEEKKFRQRLPDEDKEKDDLESESDDLPPITGVMGRRLQREVEKFEKRQVQDLESEGSEDDSKDDDVPLRPPPRPRTPAPRVPPPTNKSSLKQDFSLTNLEQLKKNVDRGGLKGVGDFGKIIDLAKKVHDKKVDTPAKELLMVDALVKNTKAYLDKRPDPTDGTPRVYKDAIEKRKIEGAKALLRQAQVRQQDLLNAKYGPDLDSPDKSVREKATLEHALAMGQNFGAKRPSGGTSDVILLQDVEGKVAYAFKSISGESDQTGMPKGSGAVREVMASVVSETIREQTGLDFGFPRVNMATINDGKGALVEGLKGEVLDGEALMKKMQDDAITPEDYQRIKQEFGVKASQVPPKQLQKALLCNLAMAQFDIKWENLMLDDSSGQTMVRPFDAGAAFPPEDVVKTQVIKRKAQPGATLLMNPGTGGLLPSSQAPLDKELVDQFLSINVDAMEAAMAKERRRLAKEHGLSPDLLVDDDAQRGIDSIRIIQDLLRRNPTQTMEEFVKAYAARLPELVS
ncbi:hypothetical protein JI742_13745 [Piscinibacter sp. Jin2]|uniref:Uncharacterized protein n=1 Tax=Aquariibacter lacus TaxID=2801332 RepID=A0A9X1BP36_9BURK|nr:hypothetical protein [Piscinibacter lacus]MBL0720945.1 hypothetical protein [Piscinibacter lacus]